MGYSPRSRVGNGRAPLFLLAPLLWMIAAGGAFTQQQERIVSPEVSADRRVTIRFRAPGAKEVAVRMDGFLTRLPMTKHERGLWSVTTEPLEPDYYGYSILMDGVALIDPNNSLLIPNLLEPSCAAHVSGPPSVPWETNEVPHGTVHHHFYHSRLVGDDRDFYVYTPPNYDARAWTAVGRANVILDDLIAQGKAKPMLIVMPLGYGAPEILQGGGGAWNQPKLRRKNSEKFRDVLLQEVVPMVESNYRVKSDRESRAIAGLSMGGAETLLVGLNNVDRFAYLGAFSSGGASDEYEKTYPGLDANAGAKLKLLWMSCGKDDHLLEADEKLRDWLEGKGIHVEWVETPGAHWWPVWRRNLSAFLPQLFREQKAVATATWSQAVQRAQTPD